MNSMVTLRPLVPSCYLRPKNWFQEFVRSTACRDAPRMAHTNKQQSTRTAHRRQIVVAGWIVAYTQGGPLCWIEVE